MEQHPAQPVRIEISPGSRPNVLLVKLSGPLTINNFFEFQELTRKAPSDQTLIVDLSAVPYIDSAALGCLVGLHVSSERTGRKYAIAGANERLKKMFDLVEVDRFLVLCDSVDEAEAKVG